MPCYVKGRKGERGRWGDGAWEGFFVNLALGKAFSSSLLSLHCDCEQARGDIMVYHSALLLDKCLPTIFSPLGGILWKGVKACTTLVNSRCHFPAHNPVLSPLLPQPPWAFLHLASQTLRAPHFPPSSLATDLQSRLVLIFTALASSWSLVALNTRNTPVVLKCSL